MTMTDTRPAVDAPPSEDGPRRDGRQTWFTSADHKVVGRVFIAGSLLFLLAGTVVGMLLRAELAERGIQITGDGGYGALFAFHASAMASLFLFPLWIGIATYMVPLQIGASGLAFPRLQAFSAWAYLVGGGLFCASYLVGVPTRSGLTVAQPMQVPGGDSVSATGLWIAALALVAVSVLIASGTLVVTVFTERAPGMTLLRMPLFTWGALASGVVALVATPVHLAGLLLLWLDQHFAGVFFADQSARVVWQHTLWLFGRPEVYLLVLPGLAAACDIVATHARRPLLSLNGGRALILLFAVLSFGAWAAGVGVAGSAVLPTYSGLTAGLALPVGLLALMWLGTLAKGSPRPHVSLVFVGAALVLFLLAAGAAVLAAISKVDGGTAWSTGQVHAAVFGPATLLGFAALYHWSPKLWGRELAGGLGTLQALLMLVGFLVMSGGAYALGYKHMPWHVADAPRANLTALNRVAATGGTLVLLGVLVFMAAVMGKRRRPQSVPNPYDGTTLEWATASPPPPANFDTVPAIRSAHPLADVSTRGEGS